MLELIGVRKISLYATATYNTKRLCYTKLCRRTSGTLECSCLVPERGSVTCRGRLVGGGWSSMDHSHMAHGTEHPSNALSLLNRNQTTLSFASDSESTESKTMALISDASLFSDVGADGNYNVHPF